MQPIKYIHINMKHHLWFFKLFPSFRVHIHMHTLRFHTSIFYSFVTNNPIIIQSEYSVILREQEHNNNLSFLHCPCPHLYIFLMLYYIVTAHDKKSFVWYDIFNIPFSHMYVLEYKFHYLYWNIVRFRP